MATGKQGYDLGMEIQMPVLRTKLRTSQADRRRPQNIMQPDQSKIHMLHKEYRTQQTSTEGGINLKSYDNKKSDFCESITYKYENPNA